MAGSTSRATLFVAGASPSSVRATRLAARLCSLHGGSELRVIDVHRSPEAARAAGIVCVPAVIWSDESGERVLTGVSALEAECGERNE